MRLNDGGHDKHEEDNGGQCGCSRYQHYCWGGPDPPYGLNQMNHPTSDMVGKDLGSTGGPHNMQIQNEHAFPPYGLPLNYMPPNVGYTPNKNVNNSTPIPIESQQPQTDHAHASQTMGETHEIPHHWFPNYTPNFP